MDCILDFPLEESNFEDCTVETKTESMFCSLKEENVVPKEGIFLGLDISKDSTGLCLYANGEKTTANIVIDAYDKSDDFAEAKARISLQKDLLEFFKVTGEIIHFNLIIIEDVFEGINPATTRLLYALNTAIDELILWGRVECDEFIRLSNQTWKSWLVQADNSGELKGLNDKIKVQRVLNQLGVSESGEGYQDRLDATGMIIGYFIHKALSCDFSNTKKNSVRVQFSDIEYAFEEDTDLISIAAMQDNDSITTVFIDDTKMSKKKMIDYLSSNLDVVFITSKPIGLGMLAKDLGLSLIPGSGGYFGFWLKQKALKRYMKKMKE